MNMFKPTLPKKENLTYFVLPKAGEPPQQGAKINAWEMVADINPACLTFSQTRRAEHASTVVLMSVWGGLMLFLVVLPYVLEMPGNIDRLGVGHAIISALLLAAGLGFAVGVPLRVLRKPRSPILLSRQLRRFYHWQSKKVGWVALNYDDVVPYVMRVTSVSQAGTSTSFFLHVGVLKPGTRKVIQNIRLSDPTGAVQPPAELWEFIRAYMDGSPAKVPPIEFRIPEGQQHGIHARMDRDMLSGLVDARHRLNPGLFPKLYFAMLAMMTYWSGRLLPWLEHKRPKPPLPPELAEAMQWTGKNPYRVTPPTDIEQKAIDGKLPYMNRRWFIGMLLSTLLWGSSFLWLSTLSWRDLLFSGA
ncbi:MULTISPECIES: DUF6708 domain-containing protein [Pseudomonas]|uniref:DUF6708 domain-containing protein n=1 Tax=Pseudomonas TaxID=286 RepID=UPI0023619233|nr:MULTISPECIES: DUF6708 domain-containing protein [Pseudomonas]WJV25579.1 hypothetical protein PSR66_05940 [Pseudomonas chlororaphis]